MIPANVKKSIEKTSDDGDKLVAVGLGMSIFVNVPWTAAAETALRSLETWRALGNEKELKYYATENMSKHRKISSTTWAMPATWLKKGAPPRETVCLELKGGVTLESASAPFSIYRMERRFRRWCPISCRRVTDLSQPAPSRSRCASEPSCF